MTDCKKKINSCNEISEDCLNYINAYDLKEMIRVFPFQS